MKVAVVGAGGIGGYFGGRWAQAGIDVTLIARGAHLEAIRERGLRIESALGDARVDLRAVSSGTEAGEVDVAVMATKAWQLPVAAAHLDGLAGPETVVVGLQNGVEAAEVLSTFVDPSRVLGGTCRIISYIAAPGVIRHPGVEPTIVIGDRPGTGGALARRIGEALARADGLTLRVSERIDVEIWEKFLFFAPLSALGALTAAPIGAFRSLAESRALLIRAMEEVYAVARAKDVALPDDSVEKVLRFVDGVPADGTSSLHRDFRDGKRSELDALCGAVVRFGEELGVPVPVHSMMYAALLPRELRARGEVEWPEREPI